MSNSLISEPTETHAKKAGAEGVYTSQSPVNNRYSPVAQTQKCDYDRGMA
jgi:hypothetical protein